MAAGGIYRARAPYSRREKYRHRAIESTRFIGTSVSRHTGSAARTTRAGHRRIEIVNKLDATYAFDQEIITVTMRNEDG